MTDKTTIAPVRWIEGFDGSPAEARALRIKQGTNVTCSWSVTSDVAELTIAASGGGGGAPTTAARAVVLGHPSSISVGSTYELTNRQAHPGSMAALQTKRIYTFPTARSIAGASPENGWTWLNRTKLTTANENTTTANSSYGLHDTTSTDWAPTPTCPVRYHTVMTWDMSYLEVVALVYSNGNSSYERCGVAVVNTGTTTDFVQCSVGAAAGVLNLYTYAGGSNFAVSITSGERDAGVWFRMVVRPASVDVYYNKTASSDPPSTWTLLTTHSKAFAAGASLGVAEFWATTAASASLAGGTKWLGWSRQCFAPPGPTLKSDSAFHATQFDTVGVGQLLGEIDLQSADVTIDNTALQGVLGSAVNRLPLDTATITWSVVRGSSAGVAAGSYSAAASTTVSGTGRYLAVYVKIVSDGSTSGSVLLPLVLPVSV